MAMSPSPDMAVEVTAGRGFLLQASQFLDLEAES